MIALLLFAAQAGASPVAPTPPAADPPRARPAPADQAAPTDPARLAAADRFLGLLHIEQQYDSLFLRLIPLLSAQLFDNLKDDLRVPVQVRSHLADPDARAAAQRIFAEESLKGFRARYPAMRTATAREYAASFSTAELDQLSAFYASPIGQKALAAIPALQAKLMPVGMAAGREVGETAFRRTLERLDLTPPKPAT